MPYTLAKFFLWGLLMALAGGVIGWLLRSLTARVQLAAARRTTVDQTELDRLRGRLANLEPVVAERDRLRMELADVRGSTAGALGFGAIVEAPLIPADDPLLTADAAEVTPVEPDPQSASPPVPADDGGVAEPEAAGEPDPDLDMVLAASVLGRHVERDDLTVVEGIGPKIAELCAALGVTTWRQLADTEVATLQSMLDDAGSKFQMYRPATWPRQGALLADGRWEDFKSLTDELGGGR